MTELTEDAFLSGRVMIRQSARGYRAGADPVFLAAAVPARSGQCVLEFGCGVGTALLCLARRVPGLRLAGIDNVAQQAALAAENARRNGVAAEIFTADIAHMPDDLKSREFDHVMANPPYHNRRTGNASDNPERESARAGALGLPEWLDAMTRRLVPGGTLTLIHRAERLPELLSATDDRLGDVMILPLSPRRARVAKLLIMQAKKGARGPFRLLPPLVLHDGDRHDRDGDSHSAAARAILRDGAALTMPR